MKFHNSEVCLGASRILFSTSELWEELLITKSGSFVHKRLFEFHWDFILIAEEREKERKDEMSMMG